MRKVLSSTLALAALYLIPLAPEPALLLHWRIVVLGAFCIVLFMTQPAISVKESRGHAGSDRYSVLGIIVSAALCQILAVLEWAYLPADPRSIRSPLLVAGGGLLMLGGLSIRLWAISLLGRFFTATVRVQSGQQVVTGGPFRLVRHPSYLGSFLCIVSGALFLEAFLSCVAAIGIMLAAYMYRINAEETAMISSFGEEYLSYSSRSYRMIPGLW